MKALLVTLLLLAAAGSSFAQKITVKRDLITLDKRPYVRVEADGGSLQAGQRTFYVSAPTGERLLVVREMAFNDPAAAAPDNLTGRVQYVQFLFPGTRTLAELPMPVFGFERLLDIGRTLYAARLLQGPSLDPQAVADFVAIHGTPYAARRQALDHAFLPPPLGY